MGDQKPQAEPTCRDCGAANDPAASECWLCQRRDWFSDGVSRPAKTAGSRGVDRSKLPVAGIIIVGAIAILSAGMALDAGHDTYFWFYFLPLAAPVGLYIWSRFRKRPLPGQPMTTLEFATALTTIAAGAILIAWIVWAGGAVALLIVLPVVLIPASLITWVRARRRSAQDRPMTGLQWVASAIFLAVLLPALILASLCIAFFLICQMTGPPSH